MQFVINNWYLFVALVVVLALLLAGPLGQFMHGIKNINATQAIQLLNRESGIMLDVCEPQEYKAGHIPNAVNVPLSSMRTRLKELEKYKNKPIVVSCRDGNRSIKGAVILRKNGFNSVFSLAGGLVAWQRENLPLDKGAS